jgi:hypothetical protein
MEILMYTYGLFQDHKEVVADGPLLYGVTGKKPRDHSRSSA